MPASGSPIASTPFGVGTPATAPVPPTAGPATARYLNPGSGDYELDSDTGQLKSMPSIRQRMMLIMLTDRGSSSALPKLGIAVPKKIDQAFDVRLRAAIRVAYSQLTDVERVVRIDNVAIRDDGVQGRRTVTISYTDLTTLSEDDRQQSIEVPI